MKALILNSGMGKRLRPFTLENPKCFAKLNGKVILEHQIENLLYYGIKDIIITVGPFEEKIKKFIETNALRSRESEKHGFEDEILKCGWVPLCRFAPEFSVPLLTSIFCIEIKPDSLTHSYFHLRDDYGLEHNFEFFPPTYLKGPFLGLLRISSKHGIQLIQNLVNHSINCWKILQKQDSKSPIPQTIKFSDFEIQIWGDEYVYRWYRHPSTSPNVLTCALMALEYWLNEEIPKSSDPQSLFSEILRQTESAAIIGVCSAVSLKNKEKCKELMSPILSNPVFWRFDVERFSRDSESEKIIRSTMLISQNKSEDEILLRLAKEEHRKEHLYDLIPQIFLSGDPNLKSEIQEKIKNFKNNLPFIFENEKSDTGIKQQLEEFCDMWIEFGMMKNYSISKSESGIEYITFTGEIKISEQQQQFIKE